MSHLRFMFLRHQSYNILGITVVEKSSLAWSFCEWYKGYIYHLQLPVHVTVHDTTFCIYKTSSNSLSVTYFTCVNHLCQRSNFKLSNDLRKVFNYNQINILYDRKFVQEMNVSVMWNWGTLMFRKGENVKATPVFGVRLMVWSVSSTCWLAYLWDTIPTSQGATLFPRDNAFSTCIWCIANLFSWRVAFSDCWLC